MSCKQKFKWNVITLCDQSLMGNSTFLGLFVYLIYLMISPYWRVLLFLIIFVDGCLFFVH